MLNTDRFEEFISQYPIYEYRLVDTAEIEVRSGCGSSANRSVSAMAPPGPVPCCGQPGRMWEANPQLSKWNSFSSVAEVSDVMNMAEMLATRDAHEELTTEVAGFLKGEGFETFTLSTESCNLCEHCAYLDGKPCRFPEKMHPCLESHGVVVNELVEHHSMEYNLGGNTILWFSLVLFRQRA